ncbi:MAG TPA: glycosyltransferase family A protein [Vicinamibacterales bacterium]|nr:glycosyltransferase family A protein [Vicinamibacterales bacterium]
MNRTEGPAVSVVMVVYNGGRHLRPALESLSAQTFHDFELVVVDDGSTDATPEVLAASASVEPRVRVVRHAQNRGLVAARNRAVAEARAPLMAIADADDLFKPNRLERQVEFMQRNPHIGFCGTAVELIDADNHRTGTYRPPQRDGDIRFFSMLGGCFWNTTTMYRTELVRQAGAYQQAFSRGAEDYDLWVRLMRLTQCANLPELLACQRIHDSSVTAEIAGTFRNQCIVARPLIGEYLGHDVSDEQVAHALALYLYGWRMTIGAADADDGIAMLSELVANVAARESRERVTELRRRIAAALFQQAMLHLTSNRASSVHLVREARRWDAAAVPPAMLVGYAARALVPAPVRTALRAIRHHVQPGVY